MSKATEELLGELHGLTAKVLMEVLNKKHFDPDTGEEIPVPAQYIAQALKLLKDNSIVCQDMVDNPYADIAEITKSLLVNDNSNKHNKPKNVLRNPSKYNTC